MVPTPSSHDFFPEMPFEDEATRVAPSGCRLAASMFEDGDTTRLYESKKLRSLVRSIFSHSNASHDPAPATKDARATIPDFEEETEVRPANLGELPKKPCLLLTPAPAPPTRETMRSRAEKSVEAALADASDRSPAAPSSAPTPAPAGRGRYLLILTLLATAIGVVGSAAAHQMPAGAATKAAERALSVVFNVSP